MTNRRSAGIPNEAEWTRLATVADLYWVQGLNVEEVGERLFLSRSTISRLLARARTLGVIEFQVNRSAEPHKRLATELGERFGIRCYVVPPQPGRPSLASVADVAAQLIGRQMSSDMTMAVAWGDTVDAISQHLEPRPRHDARIVQLGGAGSVHDLGTTYATLILDRFARAFGADVTLLPLPALFDSSVTRDAVFRERSLQHALELRRQAHLLVASVGTVLSNRPGHLYRAGYLSAADLESLQEQHVVGDLGAMFFRADGTSEGIDLNTRSTGLTLDEARRIPIRVVAAAGAWKARAVSGALAAGLITDLIVDLALGQALRDLATAPEHDTDRGRLTW